MSVVISTPIEPVLLSALQTPMTMSRDTQASSQVSAGTPDSCMALQEGQGHKDCQALTAWGASGGLETGPGRGPERSWGLLPLLPPFST